MLAEDEKELLVGIFAKEQLTELTARQTEKIAARTKIPLRSVEWFALGNGILPARYQRHVGSVSIEGQRRLLESKVIIVGLGGLGGHVAEQLARMGLGRIAGVDPDVFDETNLNRQLFSEENNLGKKKVDQASKRLNRVNKAVDFSGYSVPLEKLPQQVYDHADLVFDCLDNIEDRLMLARICSAADVPLVHGAIAGWYGHVAVVWPGSGMLETIYKRQGKRIEQELGNPPFTAALAASLMTAEGIKLLTLKNLQKEQKLLFFDLLENEWQTITF